MRIPNDAHRAGPFRVHDVAGDFQLLDVWQFPLRGSSSQFADFVEVMQVSESAPRTGAAGLLFRFREWLGGVFGWDEIAEPLPIPGCAETSVRDRLPEHERSRSSEGGPFQEVYRSDGERLAEISNSTVHALMHLAWVEAEPGRFTARMAIYVKPRGWLGKLYMALITPFRLFVVYPALLRHVARRWAKRQGSGASRSRQASPPVTSASAH